jgi:D-threo-aldose 1-dehydrogenase
LEEAFDQGITHFDVARLYSAGEAEGVVGEFARGRRDRVVFTSKVGILPLRQTYYHRLSRKVRTVAKSKAPGLTRWLPDAVHEPIFHRFSPKDIRSSVETSLRELRTDYLDVLLLHECSEEDVASSDVPTTLDKLKSEGKILGYGLATGIEQSAAIARSFFALASIIQIPDKDLDLGSWPFLSGAGRLIITHSIFAENLRTMTRALEGEDEIRRVVHARLGFDLSKPSGVAQLLMVRAMKKNPLGRILFSTSKMEHIAHCVRAAEVGTCSASHESVLEILSLFDRLSKNPRPRDIDPKF